MIPDPTDEIKAIRRRLAAKFENDILRIGADIRRQERESGRIYITLPKREPVLAHAAHNQPLHRSGEVGLIDMANQSSPPGER